MGESVFTPPLRACLRFGGRLFATIVAVLVLLLIGPALLQGKPFMGVETLLALLAGGVALGLVLGLVLYLILWPWRLRVALAGVSGRSYIGFSRTIAWKDVGMVRPFFVEGIPALLIGSTSSNKEIVAYTLGIDIEAAYRALRRHAGEEHMLTQAFVPRKIEGGR